MNNCLNTDQLYLGIIWTLTSYIPYSRHYCVFFTQFFTAIYNQEQLILQTIQVHTKQENKGLKSAVYNQERVMMERVR